MSQLNVVVTHLAAAAVDEQLAALHAIAPASRFVVVHGGRAEDAAAVSAADAVFTDDPTLRGAPRSLQSYHEIFGLAHARWVAPDPDVDAIYFFEFDHLVLRADFEASLRAVAAAAGAQMLGKTCVERTGTNWEHYARFRRDPALLAHLRRLSVRDDPTRMFGTLGSGMWLTREALAAYVAVEDRPPGYGELYVPTLVHHLGFRVAPVDGGLYAHVRWDPPYTPDEVTRIRAAGATFVHPVKDPAIWRELGPGARPRTP